MDSRVAKGGLAFLQGVGSSQWTSPRRRLTVSARGSQRWMSREERGTRSCRAPREPRKRSTEFSAALLPVPGHGRSDSARPRMAIGGRHWVGGGAMLWIAKQVPQGAHEAGHSISRSGSEQAAAASAGAVQSRTRPRERPKASVVECQRDFARSLRSAQRLSLQRFATVCQLWLVQG